jgi:hypothetical protein
MRILDIEIVDWQYGISEHGFAGVPIGREPVHIRIHRSISEPRGVRASLPSLTVAAISRTRSVDD